MKIIKSPEQMSAWSDAQLGSGKKIGLVPTMGYFHEGHLRLMRRAAELSDLVVVSLFVNPIQFGADEDLASYPRDLDKDTSLATQEGVAVLFVPDQRAMYPESPKTRVTVSGLTEGLCGSSRPGHFDGVCTVVAKLFNIVKPSLAVFGSKDYQQLAVIRRMVTDLSWDVDIIAHPIVRDKDGLAMSSRNTYLSPKEREIDRSPILVGPRPELAPELRRRLKRGGEVWQAILFRSWEVTTIFFPAKLIDSV